MHKCRIPFCKYKYFVRKFLHMSSDIYIHHLWNFKSRWTFFPFIICEFCGYWLKIPHSSVYIYEMGNSIEPIGDHVILKSNKGIAKNIHSNHRNLFIKVAFKNWSVWKFMNWFSTLFARWMTCIDFYFIVKKSNLQI